MSAPLLDRVSAATVAARTGMPPMVDVLAGHTADTRRTDPETSHEARDSSNAAASLGAVRRVLTEQGPLTDELLVVALEIAHEWGRVPQFTEQRVRTARVKFGLVEWTGVKVRNSRGRNARVWAVIS